MPIEKDQRYDAVVAAAKATEATDGKPGVWISFQLIGADGSPLGVLPKTIWLTSANRDHARKSLKALGATEAHVTTKAGFAVFFANVGTYLVNAECSVTTEETEYKGKKRIEVKWINPRVKAASGAAIERASTLFSDGDGGDPGDEPPPYDEEVPY